MRSYSTLHYFVIVLLTASLLAPLGVGTPVSIEDSEGVATEDGSLTDSSVIRISGNSALASLGSSIITGSGTSTDPYIIDSLFINATGYTCGMFIGNTTAYLTISDCLIEGASGSMYEYYNHGDGICLYNVSNVNVQGNEFNASTYGLFVVYSDNVTISENYAHDLEYVGYYALSSTYLTFQGNLCHDSSTGMAASYIDHGWFMDNALMNNTNDGLSIVNSNYLEIVNNTVIDNARVGLNLYVCAHNVITDNNCSSNDNYGLLLDYETTDSVVERNLVSSNYMYGIYVVNTHDNIIRNNTVWGQSGWYGIYLRSVQRITVIDNDVFDNAAGITLHLADNNTIEDNLLTDNGQHIYTYDSADYNVISGNIITGGSTGIWFYNSGASYNTITDNLIQDLYNYGICFEASNSAYNTVSFNSLRDIDLVGVVISGSGSNNNLFYCNSFFNCDSSSGSPVLDYRTNYYNTSSVGNYYSDHISPDSDWDGIVDDPFSLGSAAVDNYPLTSTVHITTPSEGYQTDVDEVTVSGIAIAFYEMTALSWYNEATGEGDSLTLADEWSVEVDLDQGSNLITISMSSRYGTTYNDNITVICTAPALTTDPAEGSLTYTNGSTQLVWIHAEGYSALSSINVSWIGPTGGMLTHLFDVVSGTSCTRSDSWGLDEGTTVFIITVIDSYGNSTSSSFTVVRDSVAPEVVISSPNNGSYTWQNDVDVEWTASDDIGLEKVEYSIDSGAWVETDGSTLSLIDLSDGWHTVRVRATDLAASTTLDNVTFCVDTVWPSMSITGPASGSWFAVNDVTVTWTASDSLSGVGSVAVTIDASTWIDVTGSNNYTFQDLNDGFYGAQVKVTDRAGLSVTMATSFYVDANAPSVTVTSHADGGHYTGSNVSWTVTDYSGVAKTEISTNGTDWTVITGTYYDFGLADGEHTIYLRLTDNVGHNVTVDVTFMVDNFQPEVDIISPVEDDLMASGFTVAWNGSDALSGIDHYAIKVDGGAWNVISGNSTTVSGLSDSTHTIYVRAYDRAGNVAEDLVNVTVDAIAPVVTITSPASDQRMNSADVTVTWTLFDVNDIDTLEIKVDAGAWTSLDEDALSSLVEDLFASPHTITVRATDIVGNTATDSVTIVIDLTAPTADVSPTGNDVALNESITVEFSEAMDHSATTITVSDVSGTVTWNGTVATFSHSGLAYNTKYTVTVSGKDLAGNTLGTSWTFNTTQVGTVTGTVVDEQGDALAGANITMNGVSVLTDDNGNFTFEDVRADEYELTIALNGYGTLTMDVTLIAAQTVELGDLEMTALKGAVVGTIVDGDGVGLAGANVTLNGAYVITGANGSFSFNNVLIGQHRMTVALDGYAIFNVNVNVTVATVHLGNLSLVTLPGLIEGVVLDEDGHAIAGATVTLNSTTTVTTAADGSFSFTADAGTYSLKVEKVGFNTLTMNVTAIRNDTTDLGDLELTSSVDTGDIEGALVDDEGNVMSNVTVTLSNGMTTTTDAYGRFSFQNVTVGNYTLTIDVDGYDQLTEVVTVEEDETATFNDLTLNAEDTDESGANSGMMLMIVAVLAIAAIAVIVVVFLRRRPKKP
ncbi:MAG: carboxypeptidase regulatory-like domain-containing protein [Methanomassiliicoccales archaeon]|nr:carboxypeptidase regulatory-like domain-containing protein [Methanomassiliicoccales archaeon]